MCCEWYMVYCESIRLTFLRTAPSASDLCSWFGGILLVVMHLGIISFGSPSQKEFREGLFQQGTMKMLCYSEPPQSFRRKGYVVFHWVRRAADSWLRCAGAISPERLHATQLCCPQTTSEKHRCDGDNILLYCRFSLCCAPFIHSVLPTIL